MRIQRSFRFLSGYLMHDNFGSLVNENWDNVRSLEDSIKRFMAAVKVWNKNIYGYILERKRAIFNRLGGIQKALEKH